MNNDRLEDWLLRNAMKKYGRTTILTEFRAGQCALIVVDMQNYFLEDGYLAAAPQGQKIVSAINELAQAVRNKGGFVIWITTTAEPEAIEGWTFYQELFPKGDWRKRCVQLSESHQGYQLWKELDLSEEDVFIKKNRFSPFSAQSSNLDDQLKNLSVETLFIAGVATDICCDTTARDAMMLNYRTVMVHDALAAHSQGSHEDALKRFHGRFGDVQSVEQVVSLMV